MKIVDAMKKPCPIPVIETKKVLETMETGQVKTLVDNVISTQNLEKMAKSYGFTATTNKIEDAKYEVIINVTHNIKNTEKSDDGPFVIAITSDTFGSGDDRLGRTLMKAFIQSVTELDKQPDTIIFVNGGAKLTVKDASTLLDIELLEKKGTSILTCGACLDFYGLTDNLAVGEISNMFTIATLLSEADRLVQIS